MKFSKSNKKSGKNAKKEIPTLDDNMLIIWLEQSEDEFGKVELE